MESADVQAFTENPAGLLTRHMSGGTELTRASYNLIVTDPTTVDALVGLIGQSNSLQKFALGTGMGDAVRQCSANDPAVADAIQTAIAALNQPEFEIAFTQSINQIETAAIPGAGGSGPFGTSATMEGLLGGDGVGQGSVNYFTGGGAGSPRSNRSGNGSSASLETVSP
ncbi:hypothetical protein GCM10007276_27490 [Agaricicola taiwanensis]|uniref:Uncharacterized protein n=2 Tax=Agaricicola taiwanensis TaxID=591372 RepID=A0A8J2YKK7_9RHOB|nr:hypothetical protein GCM10007276_27490 [Agaricicola taiwanensis]